jgi:hypothetical protein
MVSSGCLAARAAEKPAYFVCGTGRPIPASKLSRPSVPAASQSADCGSDCAADPFALDQAKARFEFVQQLQHLTPGVSPSVV